jgi:hypothetical protein
LEEPYLVHDIGYGAKDFEIGFDLEARLQAGRGSFPKNPHAPREQGESDASGNLALSALGF